MMNPLATRFSNTPVLVSEDARDLVTSNLHSIMSMEHSQEIISETASNDDNFWPDVESWKAQFRPYVVKEGILHIPVKGVLLHDFPWQLFNWATGYDYIWRAFERGMNDEAVEGIALVVDSPGGMVAGCFDMLDKMNALKAEVGKPVQAFAHESAYSAAYATIMCADKITVSRTGGVGSIGILTSHIDVSGSMDQRGFKMTFIHAGKHKVDGNPYEPLPDSVKARIQERIDELYAIFVSAVAQGRDMDEQAVRDTEALTFTATQSLSNGLADAVGTLDDALAAFAVDLSNPSGDEQMTNPTDKSAETAAADLATARAEGVEAGKTEGAATAKQAERERILAITGSEEAKGRKTLADYFALETDMSVDDAKAALAKSALEVAAAPEKTPAELAAEATAAEEAAAPKTPFSSAMESGGNPEIGAEGGNPGGNGDVEDDGSDTVALARRVGVTGFAKAPAAA